MLGREEVRVKLLHANVTRVVAGTHEKEKRKSKLFPSIHSSMQDPRSLSSHYLRWAIRLTIHT